MDKILNEQQRALWHAFKAIPDDFVLIGATAIAYHLENRPSDGFDFYVYARYDQSDLVKVFPELADANWSVPTVGRFNCLLGDSTKAVRYQFLRLDHKKFVKMPERVDGVLVASLIDLFAIKLYAVCQRANMKDYIDIDAILTSGLALEQGLGAAKALFGKLFDPLSCLKALCSYQDGNLNETPEAIQKKLIALATKIDEIPLVELDLCDTNEG